MRIGSLRRVSFGGMWRQDICGFCNVGGERATMALYCALSRSMSTGGVVLLGCMRERSYLGQVFGRWGVSWLAV